MERAIAAPRLALLPEKRDPSYEPSYEIDGPDLGDRQRDALAAAEPIPGWLRPEDALKLYELAYFAPGPILEIGCYQGKSTVVIARALADRDAPLPFMSLDVDERALRAAGAHLAARGLGARVVLVRGGARAWRRGVGGLAPALVFLDGDHSRAGVERDLAALRDVVPAGAALLFHDYHDPGNADPGNRAIDVVAAVASSWVAADCDFGGIFGCCGLFVRRDGPPVDDPVAGGPPLVDLLSREDPLLRYRAAVRRPLGRRLRALRRTLI